MHTARRKILDDHGLTIAPRAVKSFFWRRYNTSSRRKAGLLGELAAEIVSRQPTAGPGQLARLSDAWLSILPDELGRSTKVESFSGGRLQVIVDSAATRYVLGRQLAEQLTAALNEVVGATLVRKIDYSVGRVEHHAYR